MMMMRRVALLAAVFLAVRAEDAAAVGDHAAAPEGDEAAPSASYDVMKDLTIAMASEVIDERTFAIRESSSKAKTIIRLGNVAPLERGSLTEEEFQERAEAGKAALAKLVDKSMLLRKAAPDEHQPKDDEDDPDYEGKVVVADAWTVDGHHLPTMLKNEGHLVAAPMYESELAKDILTAAADIEKRDSYKKLEEALKESEAAKAADRKAQQEAQRVEQEAEDVEPIGVGGWIGLVVLTVLVVGAVTNFGRSDGKKANLNRRKGGFEKLWAKIKGQ